MSEREDDSGGVADDLPRVCSVRQSFERPRVDDPPAAARGELARLFPPERSITGRRIALTVGSRGITGLRELVGSIVSFLRERGARPFVVPAMGCHGGARTEAQAGLIAHYGITEEAIGCPIEAGMETRRLGRSPEGIEVRIAESAWRADGILLFNRVKPHTDFKASVESGLSKIIAIGLGKYDGAREVHRHVHDTGLGEAILAVARRVLATGKVLGGLAVLENAYHETARLVAVEAEGMIERERELLEEARRLMPRLPLEEIDVLVCDFLGKNISGAGMDSNVIGRSVYGYIPGVPWCEGMPSILRIVVRDITPESEGNAVGMGLADFTTERFLAKVDRYVTQLNGMTACAPANSRPPLALKSEREAILAAIRTARRRPEGPRLIHIRDTLSLSRVRVSEACLPLLEGRPGIEVVSGPEPLRFDAEGFLESPLEAE